jgi:hypothetical protein
MVLNVVFSNLISILYVGLLHLLFNNICVHLCLSVVLIFSLIFTFPNNSPEPTGCRFPHTEIVRDEEINRKGPGECHYIGVCSVYRYKSSVKFTN